MHSLRSQFRKMEEYMYVPILRNMDTLRHETILERWPEQTSANWQLTQEIAGNRTHLFNKKQLIIYHRLLVKTC
jgi:hypothetical protein